MEVVTYKPELHQEQLISWYNQWNIPLENLELIPETGLIIEGVCALFWYETNSRVVFLENLVSNRDVSDEIRQEALNAIFSKMKELMYKSGCKRVIGFSRNPMVLKRAVEFGCYVADQPFYILYRSL